MLKQENILKQEEEFLKVNEKIEAKTRDLMTRVKELQELQSGNVKLYDDWEKSVPAIPSLEQKKETENSQQKHIEAIVPNTLYEDNFGDHEHPFRQRVTDSNSGSLFCKNVISGVQGKEIDLVHCLKQCIDSKRAAHLTSVLCSNGAVASVASLEILRKTSETNKQEKLENEMIPEALKGVGHEGIKRFLTAKVKLLAEQIDIMQKDEKKHLEKIKELQLCKDKLTEEQNTLVQQANVARSSLIKHEQRVNAVGAQLQVAQTENNHLKKELDSLRKDMRQNNKNYSANELKLNRSLEEIEKLKTALQVVKHEEKESKEKQKKKIEDLSNTIKKLDRQRIELLIGFKKQLLIIDNLKRQKALIEAKKLLECADEDFINFLECNPPSRIG